MSSKDNMLLRKPSIGPTGYREQHRPHNQNTIEGIALNPNLRARFDITQHNDRDPEEVRDWWNNPYIVTKAWGDIETAFEADRALLRTRYVGDCTLQQEQMERARRAARADWFDKYPYGIRYEVRCLDGGVPNRATVWGTEGTLKAAIQRAKAGPPWCKEQSDIVNIGEGHMVETDAVENEASELERELVHWIIKTTDKETTEAERRACELWLAKNEVHRALYNGFMAMWNSPAFELALREFRARWVSAAPGGNLS